QLSGLRSQITRPIFGCQAKNHRPELLVPPENRTSLDALPLSRLYIDGTSCCRPWLPSANGSSAYGISDAGRDSKPIWMSKSGSISRPAPRNSLHRACLLGMPRHEHVRSSVPSRV